MISRKVVFALWRIKYGNALSNGIYSVRIAGLKSIEACVAKLGDSYQNLLHESAPFLAELLEDDDKEVEKRIHQTIRYLEDTFKDEISSYFWDLYTSVLTQQVWVGGFRMNKSDKSGNFANFILLV